MRGNGEWKDYIRCGLEGCWTKCGRPRSYEYLRHGTELAVQDFIIYQ